MWTITKIRKSQYDDKYGRFPFLKDWKKNPYSFLKAKFYIETSVILVRLLLNTKISPNAITILYGWAGMLGCICLIIPSDGAHFCAAVIFFSKGILDWSDGLLARVKKQTSITGHVLDGHGALLNDLGLQIGLGFYAVFSTGFFMFHYLIPILPFLYAAGLRGYSEKILFTEMLKQNFLFKEMKQIACFETKTYEEVSNSVKRKALGKYSKWFNYLNSFLDARARNVDLICLLLIVEIFTDLSILWIVFLLFIVKGLLLFIGSYFFTIRNRTIEKKLFIVLNNINNYIKKH